MNEHAMGAFLESCGASGPLQIEIQGTGKSSIERHTIHRPFLLIGRHSRADVTLDHDEVSQRHAYLQVVGGSIFCVDLESRTGTWPEQAGAVPGWLGPSRTIRLGPFSIRAWVGDLNRRDQPEAPLDDPSPLSSAYARGRSLAEATLEIRGRNGGPASYRLDRAVTLFGESALCKIRFRDANASKFFGALVRTPIGVWVVDLRSSAGVRVNGLPAHQTLLSEGDVLQVGRRELRLAYDDPDEIRDRRGQATGTGLALAEVAVRSGAAPGLLDEWDPSTSANLQPLLHQVARMQQQMCDQFQHAMLMMSQMFGSMHRDHMEAVQAELEQIRRLTEAMQGLKESSTAGQPDQAASALPGVATPPPEATPHAFGVFPGIPDPSETESRPRIEPQEIHSLVSERLAAFERERQTRWNKILRLLTNA